MAYTVGVVGCGRWGTAHLHTLLKLKQRGLVKHIVACDILGERLASLPNGIDGLFTSLEAMCNATQLDLVTLATPNSTHVSIGIDLLSRGIQALVEKPLSTTYSGVKQLVEAAQHASQRLHSGYLLRYQAGVFKARQCISNGDVGAVQSIRYVKFTPRKKSPESNVIDGLASHGLDTIPYLTGVDTLPFFTHFSTMTKQNSVSLDEARECQLNATYARNGGIAPLYAEVAVGWEQPERSHITVVGTKNTLRFDLKQPEFIEIGTLETGFQKVKVSTETTPLEAQYEHILTQSKQSTAHSQTHLSTAMAVQRAFNRLK